ncbi:MAG: type II toxin-antitoxin system RelE/ParE family toxin [Cyclobacteriaceae bacterium]
MEKGLTWNKSAANRLSRELKRISQDSILQAERVEEGILKCLDRALKNPESYPLDKYKLKNNGDHRAFETHSYRVSYRHLKNEVRVLRIRHVKQCPKDY